MEGAPVGLVHVRSVQHPTDAFGNVLGYYLDAELFLDAI
jgi:hypothetical protein